MIWLAWRRHRLVVLGVLGLTAALGLWMAYVGHSFESMLTVPFRVRPGTVGRQSQLTDLQNQTSVINLVLLFLPCLVGLVLGAPLIAGEYGRHTNRLAWMQGVSRTRWALTSWWVVGLPLIVLAAALTPVVQWWSVHSVGRFTLNLFGFGLGHMQPQGFAVTGVVPVFYTLFAFTLGAALGAVLRRTAWAATGTVVLYGLLALLMATTVRPVLAPQQFDVLPSAGTTTAPMTSNAQLPWDLGFGFRFVPGHRVVQGSASADVIGQRCEQASGDFLTCVSSRGVQQGVYYQPADHYWALQWRESAIYLGLSALLFGATLWAVRRWRS